MELARAVDRLGGETGLPFIAVSADITDPAPMLGPDRKPLAETVFRWLNPDFFHMTNASRKLGVSGRSQTIRLATNLGDISPA